MKFHRFAFAEQRAAAKRWRRMAQLTFLGSIALALTACGGGGGDGGGGGGGNTSPIASFTATPNSGKVPLTVAFDASASRDPDGSITGYAWSFSDGSAAATGVTTSRTFNTPATIITVTLTVTDNRGATASATRQVTVQANTVPTASFTATPTSGRAPLEVAFDASASADPDGTIASYSWTFGDGGTATSVTPTYTYNTGGTFTATLQVTDNQGAIGTATRQITVQPPIGSVNVTVTDNNGQPVPGARAVATVGDSSRSGTTGADGKVLLTEVIAGGGTLAVSRDTFVSKEIPIVVPVNQAVDYTVALDRVTRATGGVLTTTVIPGTLAADGKTVEFSVQVVVVDQNSIAIGGLTAAAFNLPGCTPDAAISGPECVAASVGNDSSLDAPYTVLGPAPSSFEEIPGGLPQPYAAALAFDQSTSISTNDPTDARLYSAEEFLKGLGADDRTALAAFADDGATAGNLALIPEKPVTIYPVGAPSFFQSSNVSELFPTLDALAVQEGGATPLYHAICRVIDFSSASAPAGPRKAVVVFTDGRNQPGIGLSSYLCNTIDAAVARSKAQGVDIFTIGLSGAVDGLALGTLAAEGNGVFLFAEDVSQLITIYGSLGNLLSRSLTTYKLTYRIGTDVAGTFQVNRRIRGTLTVNTGTNTVNLPFVVRIFGP